MISHLFPHLHGEDVPRRPGRDLASASDEQLLAAVADMFDALDPPPTARPVAAFTPPDAEALETGRRFPPLPALFGTVATVHGLLVAYDRTGAIVTPLTARGPVGRASRPSYPGSTSRVLGEIDSALYEAAWRDNAQLRRERDKARAEAIRERTRRQDAQMRLATAETQRDALQAELDAARDRIAELVADLRARDLAATEGGE